MLWGTVNICFRSSAFESWRWLIGAGQLLIPKLADNLVGRHIASENSFKVLGIRPTGPKQHFGNLQSHIER